jgi:hypothetical protein
MRAAGVGMDAMEQARIEAAAKANAADAALWRWLTAMLEERRIKWRYSFSHWVVNVDRNCVATEASFDRAIRAAKENAERRGLGGVDGRGR